MHKVCPLALSVWAGRHACSLRALCCDRDEEAMQVPLTGVAKSPRPPMAAQTFSAQQSRVQPLMCFGAPQAPPWQ